MPFVAGQGTLAIAYVVLTNRFVFVAADYSQIELRVLVQCALNFVVDIQAHFSQDEALVSAFHEGRDIHTTMAAEIYSAAL